MTLQSDMTEEGAFRSYLSLYRSLARIAIIVQLQYRASNYFYMVGMIIEPLVYLVVWSVIAEQEGGSVSGFTAGTFAAYYIVWTLVRNMNVVFTPFGWEERIREGELSAQLARPMHPINYDLAFFAGWKVIAILYWIPIALVLTMIFKPQFETSVAQLVVFCIAIWGAYIIRSLLLWCLGMVTFWTIRVTAVFELFFAAEILLSGRVVPMRLMPEWVQSVAKYLPFESTFGFPITALVGPVTSTELIEGLVRQLLWIVGSSLLVAVVWKRAVRVYSAVAG